MRSPSHAWIPDRILIYGVTGSGKTTLAEQVAARTGLPWHAVDDLTWEPGWVEVPRDEQRRRIATICAQPRWILDSAYSHWLDVPMAGAQLIVGLDYPRWVSLSRLLSRTTRRCLDHRPVCNGNTETFRQALSQESIVAWHFRSFSRKRQRLRAWEADPTKPAVLLLTSTRATRQWLDGLAPVASAP